jgi:hypothetical protein
VNHVTSGQQLTGCASGDIDGDRRGLYDHLLSQLPHFHVEGNSSVFVDAEHYVRYDCFFEALCFGGHFIASDRKESDRKVSRFVRLCLPGTLRSRVAQTNLRVRDNCSRRILNHTEHTRGNFLGVERC